MNNYPPTVNTDHPALGLRPRKIRDWDDWLLLWKNAASFAELAGLLQAGFSLDLGGNLNAPSDDFRRLEFYLSMANNWQAVPNQFRLPDDPVEPQFPIDRQVRELRQALASEAYRILCQEGLKPATDEPRLLAHLASSEALKLIVEFFRPEYSSGRPRIRNIGYDIKKPPSSLAHSFLSRLCIYGLGLNPQEDPWPEDELREGYGEYFMQLLNALGNIRRLLDNQAYLQLTPTAWHSLEMLALGGYAGTLRARDVVHAVQQSSNEAAAVYLVLTTRKEGTTP